MATSPQEADEMIAACTESGATLVLDHPRRYHPTYEAARARSRRGNRSLRLILASAVAGMVHNGTHFFDLVRYFGGEAVSVVGRVREHPAGDGDGWARVTLAGGCEAVMDAEAKVEPGLMLLGERGRIEIDHSFGGFTLVTYEEPVSRDTAAARSRGSPCRERQTRRIRVASRQSTMVAVIRDGLDAALRGRVPRSSGADGAAALEMAIGAFVSSARESRPVALPLADRSIRVVSR